MSVIIGWMTSGMGRFLRRALTASVCGNITNSRSHHVPRFNLPLSEDEGEEEYLIAVTGFVLVRLQPRSTPPLSCLCRRCDCAGWSESQGFTMDLTSAMTDLRPRCQPPPYARFIARH